MTCLGAGYSVLTNGLYIRVCDINGDHLRGRQHTRYPLSVDIHGFRYLGAVLCCAVVLFCCCCLFVCLFVVPFSVLIMWSTFSFVLTFVIAVVFRSVVVIAVC